MRSGLLQRRRQRWHAGKHPPKQAVRQPKEAVWRDLEPWHSARPGNLRQRLLMTGYLALLSTVTLGCGIGFSAMGLAVALADDEAWGVLGVLYVCAPLILIGLVGVWLTVPRWDDTLRISLDSVVVARGGQLTGTLFSEAPGPPVDLVPVCRLDQSDAVGSWHLPHAAITGTLPQQRFSLSLPGDCIVSAHSKGSLVRWCLAARRPRKLGRQAVTIVPFIIVEQTAPKV